MLPADAVLERAATKLSQSVDKSAPLIKTTLSFRTEVRDAEVEGRDGGRIRNSVVRWTAMLISLHLHAKTGSHFLHAFEEKDTRG